jgi:hypothetical protein
MDLIAGVPPAFKVALESKLCAIWAEVCFGIITTECKLSDILEMGLAVLRRNSGYGEEERSECVN